MMTDYKSNIKKVTIYGKILPEEIDGKKIQTIKEIHDHGRVEIILKDGSVIIHKGDYTIHCSTLKKV